MHSDERVPSCGGSAPLQVTLSRIHLKFLGLCLPRLIHGAQTSLKNPWRAGSFSKFP